ncbi:glutathione S-transferase [Tistlia consotensis]|uniref:Glutathione S-transferase n=1 Tax=Tistlia consotensis USBA 355 TaxID=560819 RepID=A0A1Y6BRB4_9PROT|nr:glutathione S-transferase family protein [Tistlia consotensis]SMF24212.1 glutathione S-transferase [Tistlia consotensis USBA 355]SNR60820.1 glutathione S-transferase [Tistlia consotensis]
MKLYSAPLSLFARKVEIALAEKGLAFERVMVPFSQERGYAPKHPDVLAANPKGQVPVLLDGDLTLYDSTVILEYLEDAYPQPPLYPSGPAERARCRQLELYADEVMLPPVRALMHRPGPKPADAALWDSWEAEAAKALPAIARQYETLDRRLEGREHLCGAFGVADIAVFLQVLYGQRLAGPPLEPHAALSDWWRRVAERPSVAPVAAELVDADRALSRPVAGAWAGTPRTSWLPAAG